MDITTSLAASRLVAQQHMMDITANNIANANTPGYRTTRLVFSDYVDRQAGIDAPRGAKYVTYSQDRATWREAQAGTITHTGNTYDLALSSDGYFQVRTPAGTRLTRDGRFDLAANGTLIDSSGHAVLGTNGQPVQIPPGDTQVSISGDGSISTESGQVGQIAVVQPDDPYKLKAEGGTTLRFDGTTTPVASPGIVQGAIEESNVQPALELTRMLDNERQFQMVTQLVQAEGDRQQNMIDKLLPQGQ